MAPKKQKQKPKNKKSLNEPGFLRKYGIGLALFIIVVGVVIAYFIMRKPGEDGSSSPTPTPGPTTYTWNNNRADQILNYAYVVPAVGGACLGGEAPVNGMCYTGRDPANDPTGASCGEPCTAAGSGCEGWVRQYTYEAYCTYAKAFGALQPQGGWGTYRKD